MFQLKGGREGTGVVAISWRNGEGRGEYRNYSMEIVEGMGI